MIVACYEKGWFNRKTDYRLWSNLCRSMDEPFQLVKNLEDAEFPEDHKVIVLDETGDETLHEFVHPRKAVYVFGRSCLNRIQDIVKADHVVRVDTPYYKDIFGISIASMVLYDRRVKSVTTYTDRGDPATAKASGTTLVIKDVTAAEGDFLCIRTGGKSISPPSSVLWGNREMNKVLQRIHATAEFTANYWSIRRVLHGGTRDVTITWPSAITTKIASAFTLSGPHVIDEVDRSLATASTAPSVGPTETHLRRDNFCDGMLLAEGPTNDAVLTGVASEWTLGPRVGTVGVPPISNLTMNTWHQQCADCAGVTLSGTATTARDWIGLIASFKVAQQYCIDISGSVIEVGDVVDYQGVEEIVSAVYPNRNVIDLPIAGTVSAVECEVVNN